MAEVGVCEDEAGGGRVLDSRPDKLLDRELWASCRGLDACPEFLLPPRAEIFPEVLQSPKLSLFQLEGKTLHLCRFPCDVADSAKENKFI